MILDQDHPNHDKTLNEVEAMFNKKSVAEAENTSKGG